MSVIRVLVVLVLRLCTKFELRKPSLAEDCAFIV